MCMYIYIYTHTYTHTHSIWGFGYAFGRDVALTSRNLGLASMSCEDAPEGFETGWFKPNPKPFRTGGVEI